MKNTTLIASALIVSGTVAFASLSNPDTSKSQTSSSSSSVRFSINQETIDSIVTKQSEYFAKNGKYWQGLPTADTVTETAVTPSKLSRKPHDVDKTWTEMGISLPAKTRFTHRVDTYHAPEGKGYTITLETKQGGKLYRKVMNFGALTDREMDWTLITPPSL